MPEVQEFMGLSKATLHYWWRFIELSPEAKRLIAAKRKASSRANVRILLERRRRGEVTYPSRKGVPMVAQVVAAAPRKTLLAYRPNEAPLKKALESIYGTPFSKEVFDSVTVTTEGVVPTDVIIPFASKRLLIAVGTNSAVSDQLPARFACVSSHSDKRQRIAYISRLGGIVEERLKKLRVRVLHVDMLTMINGVSA